LSVDERIARDRHVAIAAACGVAIIDEALDGTITGFDATAESLLGYRAHEIVGRSVLALIPGDRQADERRRRANVAAGCTEQFETVRRAKDGRVIDVEVAVTPLRGPAGDVTGALSLVRDVSARRRTEQALDHASQLLATAQELAEVGVWEWDLDRDHVEWSDEVYRICGVAPAELAASFEALVARVHGDDARRLRGYLEGTRATGAPLGLELRVVRPDGETRTASLRARMVGARRVIGTFADVTSREQLAARLVISDRMVSIGTLAAGVAHEINNPLAFVVANLDMVATEIRERCGGAGWSEISTMLDEAGQGAQRIRNIVRGLTLLGRHDDGRTATVAIEPILELALGLANNEIKLRARLVKSYEPTPLVLGNEAQLAQVFVNLLINAAEAIPEGQLDRHEVRVTTRSDASGAAVIEIRDTGAGIPPEIQGRIFDPFFTTKPVGQGSGLGLSICHGIVRSLGGEISFRSEPRSTTFRIVLPPAAQPAPNIARPRTVTGKDRGRVLIVDDEVVFARSLQRYLSREHEVEVVDTGRAAIDRIRAGERYDAIICDVMMPDLTGPDVHRELAQVAEDQARRIIFMTGGAFSLSAQQFLDRTSNQWFEKPCDLGELRRSIRGLITKR